ncbi:DUF4326 protein [Fadolivirus algeromassiliense]|jgi:hypothetical protein|uniref:DUF4326 protein n=1 Tax=Fadolivirus FV1/VV64 TaxID=3070911 RepID=A0A7D3V7V1_9VIRU|nr:DUF4326 protein [Fadolivirus algeromassiliense]QKF94416.1 DUF4326 protein [Fadolivirus FV1/VV64]
MTSVISVRKANLVKLGYQDLEDWLKNPNHVYIGRDMSVYVKAAKGSKWCNPFNVKKYGLNKCLELYTEYIKSNKELLSQLNELDGKVLGCWCREDNSPDIVCHGDVLVQLIKLKKTGKLKI